MIANSQMEISPSVIRPGLALNPGRRMAIPARVRWLGPGRVAPPFFRCHLDNGPTELAALQGTFYSVIAVRFRHRAWISLEQHMERCKIAVREKLRWNRLMDDYFVN